MNLLLPFLVAFGTNFIGILSMETTNDRLDTLIQGMRDLEGTMKRTKRSANLDKGPPGERTNPSTRHERKMIETLHHEIRQMRLQQANESPVVRAALQQHEAELRRLQNATRQMTSVLADLQLRGELKYNQIIDHSETTLHHIQTKMHHIGDNLTQLQNRDRWTEHVLTDLKTKLAAYLQNVTKRLDNLDEVVVMRTTRELATPTNPNAVVQPSIRLTESSEIIEGSGDSEEQLRSGQKRGENKHNLLYTTVLPPKCDCAQMDERMRTLERELRRIRDQTETRAEKCDQKIQDLTDEQQTLMHKIDVLQHEKADAAEAAQSDEVVLALRHRMDEIEGRVNETMTETKEHELDRLASEQDTQTELIRVRTLAGNAHALATIVKEIQVDHFSVIQELQQDVNIMESDLLRYGLKLTTLHAEFLNETLNKQKDIERDLRVDMHLVKLNGRMQSVEQQIPTMHRELRELRGELELRPDYRAYKDVEYALSKLNEKMSEQQQQLHNASSTLSHVRQNVHLFQKQLPQDCSVNFEKMPDVNRSRVTLIRPMVWLNTSAETTSLDAKPDTVEVLCDGEWTVLQRRVHGRQSFNRTFREYVRGFGNARADHWIGLENIRRIVVQNENTGGSELLVRTWDVFGMYRLATFEQFAVADAHENYRLTVGSPRPSSNLSVDALLEHDEMMFSAFDQDNDRSSTHCARYYAAGWWYNHCHRANLNGNFHIGMVWFDANATDWLQLAKTEMLIKPRMRNATEKLL